MDLFSHNIYQNIRTRVVVIHQSSLLLMEPQQPGDGWRLPGGGLEPGEGLFTCAEREVLEETGIPVRASGIAFLREFILAQDYDAAGEDDPSPAYYLEVYLYAHPISAELEPRLEAPDAQRPVWIALERLATLPIWPKELRALAATALSGQPLRGAPCFTAHFESPDAVPPEGIIFS